MIRVILWDIDNTLLDFNVAEEAALKLEFEEFGLGEFTEELLKEYMVINRRRWQALERGEMAKLEVTEGRFVEFFDKVMEDANAWLMEHEAECSYSGGKYLGELKPEEVLMVGDSLTSDMRGANKAGMIACWYNPKGMVNDKGVKIDYEIKDLHEALKLL